MGGRRVGAEWPPLLRPSCLNRPTPVLVVDPAQDVSYMTAPTPAPAAAGGGDARVTGYTSCVLASTGNIFYVPYHADFVMVISRARGGTQLRPRSSIISATMAGTCTTARLWSPSMVSSILRRIVRSRSMGTVNRASTGPQAHPFNRSHRSRIFLYEILILHGRVGLRRRVNQRYMVSVTQAPTHACMHAVAASP